MKSLYRKLIRTIEFLMLNIHIIKTWFVEWHSILAKSKQYKNIVWTDIQQREFDVFWIQNYGRKISNRWHKMYQSSSGVFNVKYFPEILYTTKLEPKLNPLRWARLLSDKSLIELLYGGDEKVKFPKTVFLNCSGLYYDQNRRIIDETIANQLLYDSNEIVIKPILGESTGRGVRVLRLEKGLDVESSENVESIIKEYNTNYIVQERLKPNKVYASLYADSINTIRVMTYLINYKLHHAFISFRVGTNGNKVDNYHAGGITIGVGEDGRLNKLGYGMENKKYEKHPNTKVKFDGYELPYIDEITKAAYRLHGRTPHIGVISWDFAINDKNEVVLIEVNLLGQSIWVPQLIIGSSSFGENTKEVLQLINK